MTADAIRRGRDRRWAEMRERLRRLEGPPERLKGLKTGDEFYVVHGGRGVVGESSRHLPPDTPVVLIHKATGHTSKRRINHGPT